LSAADRPPNAADARRNAFGGSPRIAVVTGASSGIGASIASALAALGWRIAVGARRTDRLAVVVKSIEASGGIGFAHELDVTDDVSIDAFFSAVEQRFGVADVVVNNAGIGIPALLHEASPDDLRREVDVNLLGPMLVTRRALQTMRGLGRGDVVFVTSLNAIAPRPLQTGYTASKCGIEGVARVLKMELEGTGIRSTIVRPGPTISDFANDWPEGALERASDLWRDWALWRHDAFLPPESVAAAVVSVVTAAPGTHIDEIQVNPTPPTKARQE